MIVFTVDGGVNKPREHRQVIRARSRAQAEGRAEWAARQLERRLPYSADVGWKVEDPEGSIEPSTGA